MFSDVSMTHLTCPGKKRSSLAACNKLPPFLQQHTEDHHALKKPTTTAGEEHMAVLFISRTVNCVWLCHVTLLLETLSAPEYRRTCVGGMCSRDSIFCRESHFWIHSISRCNWHRYVCPDHPSRSHRGSKSMSGHVAKRVKTSVLVLDSDDCEAEHLAAAKHITSVSLMGLQDWRLLSFGWVYMAHHSSRCAGFEWAAVSPKGLKLTQPSLNYVNEIATLSAILGQAWLLNWSAQRKWDGIKRRNKENRASQ